MHRCDLFTYIFSISQWHGKLFFLLKLLSKQEYNQQLTVQGLLTGAAFLDDSLERLVKGYDSFGNVCNKENGKKNSSESFDGYNTSGLKLEFYALKIKIVDI